MKLSRQPGISVAAVRAVPSTLRGLVAFTLIELLMVISIIAVMVAIVLPHINLKNSNAMLSASRQLQDDLNLARLTAINYRSTVYVVVLPQMSELLRLNPGMSTNMFITNQTANNLVGRQGFSYALYATRTVGDQPGSFNPRYLTEWRSLPEGIILAPRTLVSANTSDFSFQTNRSFRFPSVNYNNNILLPSLAFGPTGRLQNQTADAIICLDRGTAFPMVRDNAGFYPVQDLEMIERPPGNWTNEYNHVVVNWLTGRTKTERPELQQ